MDDIYKGKTKEEIIELVYCLTKQNLSGRETHDEIFMKGIEFCYKELCEGEKQPDTESKCNKHGVKNRVLIIIAAAVCALIAFAGFCGILIFIHGF